MVIKTVRMGIPILVSRSGFTAWGVELARKAELTLIGRARGKRFVALSGEDRIVFDQDLAYVEDESGKHRRKARGRMTINENGQRPDAITQRARQRREAGLVGSPQRDPASPDAN